MQSNKENLIVNISFKFSLEIIKFCEVLENHRKYTLATQLFKAGTSIGANVREAQNAESKADFIHKMKIAAKEADETEYWLQLCKESELLPSNDELLQEIGKIVKILSKIISSSKIG